ncbi:hypothetical protein KC19_2G058300 [Ceratodon purpureus]|uniref:EF hand associated type-2 domain-containing protein n=1 Tax=Ceratodon purpureus TaxID=3225 RepID=A0A8T0IUI4_CERPU|nr:hypothetical protein KC19_2G058300 [Ceratodon purpureus]
MQEGGFVVLTYSCDRPQTLERLSSYWWPELRRLEIEVPIIVVGCKLDLRDDSRSSLEQVIAPLMEEFREIETCIECSALKQIQVTEVFNYAQKAVLHPTAPLFNQETPTLKPRYIAALKRIFILCDKDMDCALNDAELNEFQVKCFSAPLQASEIEGVKDVVSEKMPEGVNANGLTLRGFLFLHALFVERGRLETTWTVLRKFGYDDEIMLRKDLIQNPSFKRNPESSVELSEKAIEFLKKMLTTFDEEKDSALRPQEVEELVSTAPSRHDHWNQCSIPPESGQCTPRACRIPPRLVRSEGRAANNRGRLQIENDRCCQTKTSVRGPANIRHCLASLRCCVK